MFPGRVALDAQVLQRRLQVGLGLAVLLAIFEWLTQLDGLGQGMTGLAMQAQQALAAEHHVAVEEGFGQGVVGIVRGTGALVNVLGEKIQFQVAADLGAGPPVADPVQDDFLGRVERCHHPAILLGQIQTPCLHVQLAQRLEQRGLELEVQPQLTKQPGQAVLHRLVSEQGMPEHREQAIPSSASYQQQRLEPQPGDAAALLHADHAVHRENQRGRTERGEAFAEGAEHGQGKGRQCQSADEQPGVGEQEFDRIGRGAEATQGDQQRGEPPLPAVIGFRQGTGDHAEKQRDQAVHPALVPAQRQAAAQGDEHPQAVAELVQRPETAQRVAQGGRRHPDRDL